MQGELKFIHKEYHWRYLNIQLKKKFTPVHHAYNYLAG